MERKELHSALTSTGLPAAYRSFREKVKPPYLVYKFVNSSDLKADNQNYVAIENYQIELYSVEKDSAAERTVEGILKAFGITYSKVEAYIDTEKMNQIIYEIQITGGANV